MPESGCRLPPDRAPAWDGDSIVAAAARLEQHGAAILTRASGAYRLLREKGGDQPRCQDDGRHVLFGGAGGGGIWQAGLEDGSVRPIMLDPGNEVSFPQASRDERWLYLRRSSDEADTWTPGC